MARRIKEEPEVHQNRIAGEAEVLFDRKGIESTTMDDIAKAAGYSKATLYVYFKNKDEIVTYLALKSMRMLRDSIAMAAKKEAGLKEQFMGIGLAIREYAEEYPAYYQMSLQRIEYSSEDLEGSLYSEVYKVGEEINMIIIDCLEKGRACQQGDGREPKITDVLQIWGMITGLINIAMQKREYIEDIGSMKEQEFLREGLEKIYRIVCG